MPKPQRLPRRETKYQNHQRKHQIPHTQANSARSKIPRVSSRLPNKIPATVQQIAVTASLRRFQSVSISIVHRFNTYSKTIRRTDRPRSVSLGRAMAVSLRGAGRSAIDRCKIGVYQTVGISKSRYGSDAWAMCQSCFDVDVRKCLIAGRHWKSR